MKQRRGGTRSKHEGARRRPCGAVGLAVLACALLAGCEADAPRSTDVAGEAGPNIILVTIESHRADHVGCYGYDRVTTPSLDSLARDGVVFENAYAVTSWTLPSQLTPEQVERLRALGYLEESP